MLVKEDGKIYSSGTDIVPYGGYIYYPEYYATSDCLPEG